MLVRPNFSQCDRSIYTAAPKPRMPIWRWLWSTWLCSMKNPSLGTQSCFPPKIDFGAESERLTRAWEDNNQFSTEPLCDSNCPWAQARGHMSIQPYLECATFISRASFSNFWQVESIFWVEMVVFWQKDESCQRFALCRKWCAGCTSMNRRRSVQVFCCGADRLVDRMCCGYNLGTRTRTYNLRQQIKTYKQSDRKQWNSISYCLKSGIISLWRKMVWPSLCWCHQLKKLVAFSVARTSAISVKVRVEPCPGGPMTRFFDGRVFGIIHFK